MVAALDVKVEMSGGIRDDESLRAALATGCARVNIGTAALRTRSGAPGRSGSTARGSRWVWTCRSSTASTGLRGRGWETDGGDLWQVLERLDSEGCSRFVVTDVTKDGTLTGPNLDLLEGVAECTDAPVIASGECRASMICVPSPP